MTNGSERAASPDLETIFDTIDLPTLVLDAAGSVVVWNESLEALLGIERSAVEGVEWIGEVVYDGDRQRILAEKVLEHPETAAEVFDVDLADSEYALLDADGYPTYEDTSTAIGGSGAEIWFVAAPLYRGEEFVGVVEIVQPRTDSERRRREMERLIDELTETLSAFRDGDYTARVEYDPAGRIVEADDVEVVEEVNDLARMREALRQQVRETTAAQRELQRRNDQLERFAGVIAHDLRNPLNVAEGRLELATETATDPETLDHLEAVDRSLGRMSTLIDDLLALARAGRMIDETEAVDLGDLAEGCWAGVATTDATLAVETDRRIRADESRLRQLLENLIRNAVEHGTTGDAAEPQDAAGHGDGGVTVTVGDLADGFYVADDGPGIPEAERDRVFESGYSTSEDGTGFGLAIVAEIASAHGWEVTLTESATGGVRVEFTGVEEAE
jgi:signal transduction histidine kinase